MKWRLERKTETVRLIEENMGGKLFDISLGYDFLDLILKAKAIKAKISK